MERKARGRDRSGRDRLKAEEKEERGRIEIGEIKCGWDEANAVCTRKREYLTVRETWKARVGEWEGGGKERNGDSIASERKKKPKMATHA